MSTRAALGLSLFLTFTLIRPAVSADTLTVKTLADRIAANPTGEPAAALAEDIRTWFGKDRSGANNVVRGANPKVEGLATAWAIEAPGATTAAVKKGDGQSFPLTRIGDTPIFAAVSTLANGEGFRWSYLTDGTKPGRSNTIEVYTDQPELAEQPGVPKGEADEATPVGEQDLPWNAARLVGLCPGAVQGRPTRVRHGVSGWRRVHERRADGLRQSDRQGRNAGLRCGFHQSRSGPQPQH